MPNPNLPSVEYLRQCFRYENGRLYWLHRPLEHFSDDPHWRTWNKRFSGKEAGKPYINRRKTDVDRRWIITVNGIGYRRSHVVWAMHHDRWPTLFIDHENRIALDDRIENLREATRKQNAVNSKRRKSISGLKGAYRDANASLMKPWYSLIRVNGRQINLGHFTSAQEAHEAYMAAARKHFGGFACNGEPMS